MLNDNMIIPELTLEQMFKRKDFTCNVNVERALYCLLSDCGLSENDVKNGKYDEQAGKAKERIYAEFSKALGFDYKWSGFYHIEEKNNWKVKNMKQLLYVLHPISVFGIFTILFTIGFAKTENTVFSVPMFLCFFMFAINLIYNLKEK